MEVRGSDRPAVRADSVNEIRARLVLFPALLAASITGAAVTADPRWFVAAATIAVVGGRFALPAIRDEFRWELPEIRFAHETLRLGDVVEFSYEQKSRRPIDTSSTVLEVSLLCRRLTRNRTFNERWTRHEDLFTATDTVALRGTPTGIQGAGTLRLPAVGLVPGSQQGNPKITWTLRTQVRSAGFPRGPEHFAIDVGHVSRS